MTLRICRGITFNLALGINTFTFREPDSRHHTAAQQCRLPPRQPQRAAIAAARAASIAGGNPARVEREAVTLPLDHAFGFELADVGPAAIKVLRPVPTR